MTTNRDAAIEAADKKFNERVAAGNSLGVALIAAIAAYEQDLAKDGCEIVTVALQTAEVLAACEVWVNQSDSKASPRMNGPSMAETIRALVATPPSSAADVKALREAAERLLTAIDGNARCIPIGGACGMTIESQVRNSVYNGVPAWPVEELREALYALATSGGGE